MNLEKQLVEALRRKQAPAGMVQRVMARIDAQELRKRSVASSAAWLTWRLAAGLILIVALTFGLSQQRQARRDRQQAEFAKQQLMVALQIASHTLNEAQRMVQQENR